MSDYNGHGEKRTRKSSALMAALLTSSSLEDAASVAGISYSTARRWFRDAEFQKEFRKLQGEVTGHSLMRLKTSMADALATLNDVMNDS
jgi:molybdenum-dependent DNA-binding transcriptional regulator ModE